jgi:hypothetical protein
MPGLHPRYARGVLPCWRLRANVSTIPRQPGQTNLVGVALLSPVGIPDEFELVLPADEKRLPCTVVWRSANQIGVAFRPEERT